MKDRAMIIAAGVAALAGGALAQETERPVEEFDESVMRGDERADRRNRATGTRQERTTRRAARPPYDTQPQERPIPPEDRYDPRTEAPVRESEDRYGTPQEGVAADAAPASTADLEGKAIVTSGGEEIGTIQRVGFSRQHNERVALVDVGGFLGVGERIVAVPISELGLGREGNEVTTSMTRARLERAPAFDPGELVTAD